MPEQRGNSNDCGRGVGVVGPWRRLDSIALGVVALVVTLSWWPALASGGRIVLVDDFLMHAARHEAVRKSLLEYHAFPLRSHWFGGGFPTLGEPEDPALNPLVLLSVAFGSVMGQKLIAFVAVLAGAVGTYILARCILGFTRWGALFAALVVGASLFVPGQMWSGNLSAVCAAYVPLWVLLLGLACRGRRIALLVLPFLLCTMLSDGKQTFFMAMLYVGLLCLLDVFPVARTLTPDAGRRRLDARALLVLVLVLGATLGVGMVRILPAMEFIGARGGLTHMALPSHEGLHAASEHTVAELLTGIVNVTGPATFSTVGWLPVALFVVATCCLPRKSLPWLVLLLVCLWLSLADKAPYDLFRLLRNLPVFGTIAVPSKYLALQIVLSLALGAGQCFRLLSRLRHRWLEHAIAIVLIGIAVGPPLPLRAVGSPALRRAAVVGLLSWRVEWLTAITYTEAVPPWHLSPQKEFFSVRGWDLPRNRVGPPHAVTYFNLLANIGTIDWSTAAPIAEHAEPRYFVDAEDNRIPNALYRGEAFFVDNGRVEARGHYEARADFAPNSVTVHVTLPGPGTLVVNQNFHPAWRTDVGELVDRDGLIAVRLRGPGSYPVHLRYRPRSFTVGLIVSVLSLMGWVLLLRTSGIRRVLG